MASSDPRFASVGPGNLAAYAQEAAQALGRGQIAEAREAAEGGWALFHQRQSGTIGLPQKLAAVRAQVQLYREDPVGLLETTGVARQHVGPNPDLSILSGSAHTTLAWRADEPSERRAQLDAALQAYREALEQRQLMPAERYVTGSRPVLAWNGLGTVALLYGDPASALDCFETASAEDPLSLPAKLGRAEALIALGRAREAATVIEPLLGQTPDAWVVGASLAESLGQIGDLVVLLARCRDFVGRGLVSERRSMQCRAIEERMKTCLGRTVPGADSRLASRPATYSILLPTIRKRDDLLDLVMQNIRAVFRKHEYEVCLADVSGKGVPAFVAHDPHVRHLPIEKPGHQQIYVPFREALEASSNKAVILWADDLLFSEGFAGQVDIALSRGKQVIQAAMVDPELYLVLTQYVVTYTPCVISRDVALAHVGQLQPGYAGDVPFVEACIRHANTHYDFLDGAYLLHLGYPVGPGSQSTLVDYRTTDGSSSLQERLAKWRSDHGFRRVSPSTFPHYERLRVPR